MRAILTKVAEAGKTPAYQNAYIKWAKAFVNWLRAEGRLSGDPIANLKRVDERAGGRKRAYVH
jgi:hypothetical protein